MTGMRDTWAPSLRNACPAHLLAVGRPPVAATVVKDGNHGRGGRLVVRIAEARAQRHRLRLVRTKERGCHGGRSASLNNLHARMECERALPSATGLWNESKAAR